MECAASKLNILEPVIAEEILDKFAFSLKNPLTSLNLFNLNESRKIL